MEGDGSYLLCQANKAQSDILPPRRMNRIHRPIPVKNVIKRCDDKLSRSDRTGCFNQPESSQRPARRPLPQQPNHCRREFRSHAQQCSPLFGMAMATDFERAYAERRCRKPGRPPMDYLPPIRSQQHPYAQSEVGGIAMPSGAASCVSTRSQPAALIGNRNRHRTDVRHPSPYIDNQFQYTEGLVFASDGRDLNTDDKKNTSRSMNTFYPAIHFTRTGDSIVDPNARSTLNRAPGSNTKGLWRTSHHKMAAGIRSNNICWANQTPLLVCGPNLTSNTDENALDRDLKSVSKMKRIEETDRMLTNEKQFACQSTRFECDASNDHDSSDKASQSIQSDQNESIAENLYERIESLILIECNDTDDGRTQHTADDSESTSSIAGVKHDSELDRNRCEDDIVDKNPAEQHDETSKGCEKSDSIAFVDRDTLKAAYVNCQSNEGGRTFDLTESKRADKVKRQSRRKRKVLQNDLSTASD